MPQNNSNTAAITKINCVRFFMDSSSIPTAPALAATMAADKKELPMLMAPNVR